MADFGADDIPHARKGKMCPLNKRDMSEVCHECGWWLGIQWTDPASGEFRQKWNCAMVTNSLTNIDVTRSMSQVAASTDKCTNEMVKRSTSPPSWAVKEIVKQAIAEQNAEDLNRHRHLQLMEATQRQHQLEFSEGANG
jgi:hypothetical protein